MDNTIGRNRELGDRLGISFVENDEIIKKLIQHHKEDGARGRNVCFRHLNDFYTHKQSGVTDWTGLPASGKTYMALEVLISEAEKYGKRFALYLPDLGSDVDVFEKIFKMKTGLDFNSKNNRKIPVERIQTEIHWIMMHFLFVKKKDIRSGITPSAFWEYICNYQDDMGRLDGGLIDSWKDLKHVYSGREDQYLDEILSERNELSEMYDVHFHTIAHASKTEKDKDGKRRVPNASDIKGGGAWDANGKNIITIDFPDKTKTGVNIYINKVKPESVGRSGKIIGKIFLDQVRGRYYEFIDGKARYSFEWEKVPVYSQSSIDLENKMESHDTENIPPSPF